MTARWIVCVAALAGCTFDDPDLGAAKFKCDAAHACPDGQACVAGVCGGSGSNVATFDGVKCGAATCTAGQQCCAGPLLAATCQPAGTACTANGEAAATCDGVEDCPADQACCGASDAACGAASCTPRACQSVDDCTGGLGCCRDLPYLSWGYCGAC
ncbi:MAG: hypothetical protein NT062_18345 [Proteobacteria bacterium]|nr:hypothetical protein [Pseudomonadota bacterium]